MLDHIKHYYCRTCAISISRLDVETKRICGRNGEPVKDTDFCSHHTDTLWTCDCCGRNFWEPPHITMTLLDNNVISSIDAVVCPQCSKQLSKCATCAQANICSFETDPSSLPKYVPQQIRQGNMISVTQVMNPERIRVTCEKSCPCFSTDFGCYKQSRGTCPQYHMNRA